MMSFERDVGCDIHGWIFPSNDTKLLLNWSFGIVIRPYFGEECR